MPVPFRAIRLPIAAAVLAAGVALLSTHLLRAEPAGSGAPEGEMRSLWVLRTSLASPDRITALVRSASLNRFNTLFVQVRGRGDAYYAGGGEPRASELARQPGFDPLADVLTKARARGLRVHIWINLNLISSAVDLPRDRTHLVHRHPEWLMVPRALAPELARLDARSPAYLQALARWTRRQASVEGLYASPIPQGAVDHLAGIVGDLVRRYAVDGVHFDYARYPTDDFDYSRTALREFRAWVDPQLPSGTRRQLAARAAADALAYPEALPDEWRRFRLARMTALLTRLSATARAERPGAAVSVAAAADMREAVHRKLQEWPRWIEHGLVDAVAPMAYTAEPARFAAQIAAARAAAGDRAVWAGIGAYRLSPAQTIDNIATARRLGAGGVILFSYDSLVDPRQQPSGNYLAAVARGAFGAAPRPPGDAR